MMTFKIHLIGIQFSWSKCYC